jgi:hypothetical protein
VRAALYDDILRRVMRARMRHGYPEWPPFLHTEARNAMLAAQTSEAALDAATDILERFESQHSLGTN